MLSSFASLNEICRHLSADYDLRTTEAILRSYLLRIEAFVKGALRNQHLTQAVHIVSQGYLLAAELIEHQNNLGCRHQYSQQTLLYGKLAQARNLQVVALQQIAISFDCMRQPEKILHTSQRALPYLKDVFLCYKPVSIQNFL